MPMLTPHPCLHVSCALLPECPSLVSMPTQPTHPRQNPMSFKAECTRVTSSTTGALLRLQTDPLPGASSAPPWWPSYSALSLGSHRCVVAPKLGCKPPWAGIRAHFQNSCSALKEETRDVVAKSAERTRAARGPGDQLPASGTLHSSTRQISRSCWTAVGTRYS